jgi:hypothetical protein
MNNCDRCGLDDSDCRCYLHEIAKRVGFLEECMLAIIEDIKNTNKKLEEKNESGQSNTTWQGTSETL